MQILWDKQVPQREGTQTQVKRENNRERESRMKGWKGRDRERTTKSDRGMEKVREREEENK